MKLDWRAGFAWLTSNDFTCWLDTSLETLVARTENPSSCSSFVSTVCDLLASAAQYLHFRTFRANPRRSERVSSKGLHPNGQSFLFTKLDIHREGESGVKTFQVDLFPVLTDRCDDV